MKYVHEKSTLVEILKCLIIEDQLPAQRILSGYIEQVPNLELVGTYITPLEAMPLLESATIDILFLDIHLPKISGIDFLKSLSNPPSVILTTAFTEYALEGFELDVVDYLLKPFAFERFLKAISKIQRIAKNNNPIFHSKYLFLRTQGVIQKVEISSIMYVEAKGSFVLIYTTNNRYVANSSLQEILVRLGNNFVRCHKSYIVNVAAISKIIGNTIQIENNTISIGRTYRESLLLKLKMI